MRKSNWIISPSRGENKTYLKPPPRKHSKTPYPNQYKGMAAADAGLHVRQPEIHRRHRLENIPQITGLPKTRLPENKKIRHRAVL